MQPPDLGPAGEVELGCRDVALSPGSAGDIGVDLCVGCGSLTGMAAPSPSSPFPGRC